LFHDIFDNISTGMLDGIHVEIHDGSKNLMQPPEREAYRVTKTNAHRPFTPGSHKNVL
jgi:hypothetical protein